MINSESLNYRLFVAAIPVYIIGFIGNTLVIRIVYKTRDMHSTTNYLLANLAVSDVITILLAPLYFFSYHIGYPSSAFGKFSCKFLVLTDILITTSALTLSLLAIERYHALLKPFRTGLRLTDENIKQAIALVWILSFFIIFPEFFFQEWSESLSRCTGPWNLPLSTKSNVFGIIYYIISAYIPLMVFLYCYGSLIKGLYFSHTVCAADTNEDRSSEKKKLVITFILATTGFVIGYGPIAILYTVLASGVNKEINHKLYSNLSVFFLLGFYCSLCLNPMFYAFRSSSFKEGFKRITFCRGPVPQNEIQMP